MTPTPDLALRTLMMTLMSDVAPNVQADYLRSTVNIMAVVNLFLAEEFDRAAEVTAWENRTMRALLGRAAELPVDERSVARWREASNGSDPSLRISALHRDNVELRRMLIAAHTAAEMAEAAAIDRAIWSFLEQSARRRAFSF